MFEKLLFYKWQSTYFDEFVLELCVCVGVFIVQVCTLLVVCVAGKFKLAYVYMGIGK